MSIEFHDGSAVAHPNFERYMDESTTDGALPLCFDCAAMPNLSVEEVAAMAAEEFERKAKEEQGYLLDATLVATRAPEPTRYWRYRVLIIARRRKLGVERNVVLLEVNG